MDFPLDVSKTPTRAELYHNLRGRQTTRQQRSQTSKTRNSYRPKGQGIEPLLRE